MDPSEQGLGGQTIELHCLRDGNLVKEATTISGSDGKYLIHNIIPGKCRVRILRSKETYQFSPIVVGGNQIGSDGWSAELHLRHSDMIDLPVGIYEKAHQAVEADCDPLKCHNKVIDPRLGTHDCGWGIWNDCTCQVS